MSCASFPISVVSSNCKLNFPLRFAAAIVCCRISTESSLIGRLIVLSDKGTLASLLAHYSGHFDGCWLNQPFSCCSFCSNNFLCNRKGSSHCIFMRVGYSSPNTCTINTTSLGMQFFTLKEFMIFVKVFFMF